MPVSLSVGRARTAEFKINVESTYAIGIAVEQNRDYEEVRCLLGIEKCDGNPPALSASWSVSKAGRVMVSGMSDSEHGEFWTGWGNGRVLGRFNGNGGRYILDLNVLQDGSRLNARTPYLVIFESGGERWGAYDAGWRAFAALLLSFPVGVAVLIRSGIVRRAEKQDALLRTWPLSEPGPQPPTLGTRTLPGSIDLRHHRELRPWSAWPFSRTSWYGLIGTNVYLVILIPVWLMSPRPLVPTGLVVHLAKPGIGAQTYRGATAVAGSRGGRDGRCTPEVVRGFAARILGGLRCGVTEGAQPASTELACLC